MGASRLQVARKGAQREDWRSFFGISNARGDCNLGDSLSETGAPRDSELCLPLLSTLLLLPNTPGQEVRGSHSECHRG